MRDHTSTNVHRHDRQHRTASGSSSNYSNQNNSVNSRQQQQSSQHSPAMSQHVPHPSQLSIQSKLPYAGSTSSSLNQCSPQERQLALGDLKNEIEVGVIWKPYG